MITGNSLDARAYVADTVGCLLLNSFLFFLANRSLILLGGNMLNPEAKL